MRLPCFSRFSSGSSRSSRSTAGSLISAIAVATAAALIGGCDIKSFIDPSEMGRYKKTSLQKPILNSLSSIDHNIDDPADEFINATEVKPEDLNVLSSDYTIGKNDLVNITVSDLEGPGLQTTKVTRVSESGNISLPLIGQVHADGLTEAQLEQTIVDAYKNSQLIQNAQVSATVAEARARTFSVLGAVTAPGQYAILQSDFRILDALVLAHDVLQNVDTLYVIREVDQDPGNAKLPAPTGMTPATPATGGQTGDLLAPRPASATPTTPAPAAGGAPAPVPPPQPAAGTNQSFAFASPQPPAETRIIRVPLDPLRNGDLRYNIVVRPHDMILAPIPTVGEYYLGGHVARVGVYNLSARKITLKEAVIAAGMLDGVAIPQRCDIIRRIGTDQEVFARVNLDAIFEGSQPDLYLKPYDAVMVGTNILAPFIAAIRGGFRITYGFGFLYDRNYAPINNQNS